VRTNGTDLRQLTPDSLQAGAGEWTDHGNMITFSDNFCGSACDLSRIYTMKADGTKIKLIEDNGGNSQSPYWSPDGKQITFSGTDPTITTETATRSHLRDMQPTCARNVF